MFASQSRAPSDTTHRITDSSLGNQAIKKSLFCIRTPGNLESRGQAKRKVAGGETSPQEPGSTVESCMELLGPSTTQLNSSEIPREKKNWDRYRGMRVKCISPTAPAPAAGDRAPRCCRLARLQKPVGQFRAC